MKGSKKGSLLQTNSNCAALGSKKSSGGMKKSGKK